jgi:flavorubredoxin
LLRKYPRAIVAGDSRDFHMYFPAVSGRTDPRGPGASLDLGGGHRFTILAAPIKDAPNSVWAIEESQRVLFTADAFSYSHHPTVVGIADEESDFAVHSPGECTLMASELGGLPSVKQAGFITKAALYWTRYVEIGPFFGEIEEMMQQYRVRMIAPAHGGVIDDIDAIMPVIREAHRLAYQQVLPANRSTA